MFCLSVGHHDLQCLSTGRSCKQYCCLLRSRMPVEDDRSCERDSQSFHSVDAMSATFISYLIFLLTEMATDGMMFEVSSTYLYVESGY
jgi:hypothetical protein